MNVPILSGSPSIADEFISNIVLVKLMVELTEIQNMLEVQVSALVFGTGLAILAQVEQVIKIKQAASLNL